MNRAGYPLTHATWYALGCVIGKWPECQGQIGYLWHRWRGRAATLIEYKRAEVNT